jgi:multiple sugar transport system ATP-binding protein
MRVRFERVTKRFGEQPALRDVDLEVEPGECLVLLGPSGCGKTTLLRLLAGLETVDGGRLWIGEREVTQLPPAERDVAMVFQNYALYPHLSVFENIAFPLRARRVAAAEVEPRVRKAAERLELGPLLDRRPAQLSGGQQQRVALARAIVRSPAVCLMDEPLSNLDAQLRVQTRGELKRLQQELGTTTLYVTHDQGEAMTLGRRVALLRAGVIEQVAAPLELYRRPATRFAATFVGSPSINLWPLGRGAGGRVRVLGTEMSLGEDVAALVASVGRAEAGVRPEDVAVLESPAPEAAEGRVLVVEPMGSETVLIVDCAGQRVTARTAPDRAPEAGSPVWVRPDLTRAVFFDGETGRRLAAAPSTAAAAGPAG